MIIIIVLIGLVIVLIFNPFDSKSKYQNKPQTEENNKEDTEEKEENTTTEKVKDMPNGDIPITKAEIYTLTNEIVNKTKDYYENDTVSIYQKKQLSELTDQNKLFLLSKTNDFNSLIHNQINNETICNANIIINKSDVDAILEKRFNTRLTNYESFIYNIYEEETYLNTIKFVLENDTYVGKCHTFKGELLTLAQQKVISATKENNNLYIDVQVVFINKTGVYKDTEFTTLITNQEQSFDEYIQSGNIYRYTYNITDTGYVLTNISLK